MPILRPSSWPLSVRIACDLLIVALAPLLLAMWLVSRRGVEAIEQEARVGRQLLATVTATRLDQLLEDSLRMVADVSGDERVVQFCAQPGDRPALAPLVSARLQAAVEENPDVASAFIIDTAGIGLASTNPKNVGQDLSFRQYWREARDGRPHVSDLVVGKTSSKPGIYCSQPAWSGGAVVGVVVMKLQGERVGEIVRSASPGEDGLSVLVDADGIILAHPDPAALYHSLGELAPERLREIDPKVRYELDTIESIHQPELAETLTAAKSAGSTLFRRRADDVELVLGYAPMRKKEWLVGVAQPTTALLEPVRAVRRQQALLAAAVAALAGVYAVARARQIVRPIRELTAAAERVAEGDFETPVRARSGDEIGTLAARFGEMLPRLREGLELRRSLAVAMEVQQSLLPPRTPRPAGLEIVAHSRYCDQTGGDYYDFIDIAEIMPGCSLVAVADVMGHGVAAALIMASARAALRSEAIGTTSLADLLTRVNRVLAEDLRDGRFVTLALLMLDTRAGVIRWASAGHDPALLYSPSTQHFAELEGGGLPLGVDRRERYEQFERPMLLPGEVLFIGTDGVWEARNPDGEQYGKLRLRGVIRDVAAATTTDLAAAVCEAVEKDHAAFRGQRRIEDDVTYVVVAGTQRSAAPQLSLQERSAAPAAG